MGTADRKRREFARRETTLLAVARELLRADGLGGIGLDRVAESAEYSRGTVYKHFTCKEDLVVALATETQQQRLELLERAARLDGRAREKLCAIGEVSVLLYPHHLQAELMVYTAAVRDRASPERRAAFEEFETRNMAVTQRVVEEAIAVGDLLLPNHVEPLDFVFNAWSQIIGSHMLMASGALPELGVGDPASALRRGMHALLDGYGWRPLSTEWDYDTTLSRVRKELAPNGATVGA
jgi:AcrR family transcriptional regulator